MAFNVTSAFINETGLSNPRTKKTFTISGSDYSSYVTKWPRIKRRWDSPKPISVTITLANDEQTFNFFNVSPVKLMEDCELKLGFEYAAGSEELLSHFNGTVERVKFNHGKCSLVLTDHLKPLSEKLLGDNETPLDFTTSNYLVSDLAWYMVTSHGGFSAIANSSNPDIDYESFEQWSNVFSSDNVRVNALFDGIKITEGLRKVAKLTRSAIYMKDGKLSFSRFTIVNTYTSIIDEDVSLGIELALDDATITNNQIVNAAYNVDSDSFAITVNDEATASVNSFGLRENISEDRAVWYVDSVSALNLAQRITFTRAIPFADYSVISGLALIHRQIGETISFTEEFFGAGGEAYRILAHELDMHKETVKIGMDATTLLNAFKLDISVLDGTDTLL